MRRSLRWAGTAGLGLLALVGTTLLALEGGEVVRLHTVSPAGSPRVTRVWIADEDGAAWVEAADPERPFLADLRSGSALELERGAERRACRATVAAEPGGHERIRRLLRQRYGWKDVWIGWIADTSRSLAVELRCAGAGDPVGGWRPAAAARRSGIAGRDLVG